MKKRVRTAISEALIVAFTTLAAASVPAFAVGRPSSHSLDRRLANVLARQAFTGRIESQLEQRLGRPVQPALADLGRLIFFDNIQGLHNDNSCAGCHGPNFGMGDSGSMAIGIGNNGIIGHDRTGARNQRKTPVIVNSAFFPKLMWNGRFFAPTDDPFDNSAGFTFPAPEGTTRFPGNDDRFPVLLAAQGHIPQTELVEMSGFTNTAGTIGPLFDQFDDGLGQALPPADETGTRNEPIREVVLARFNNTSEYLRLFGEIYNDGLPFPQGGIEFHMIGQALAEFQMSLTFADAPLDRFARGEHDAMTDRQKRGALLFFGKARCVECHAVAGSANEMFSDFQNHVLGVPQIASVFGVGTGNVLFDGPHNDEDFGAEQISGDPADRYKFRTPPLRNAAVQPAFMHNGAFTRLEDAIQHHLNVFDSARTYDAVAAGVDEDLTHRMGPIEPVLERVDPILRHAIHLRDWEFEDLVAFVRDGLTDERALPEILCSTVPDQVPSGMPVANFVGCE